MASDRETSPIRSETRVALVTSIAHGRRWLDEIITGAANFEQIAAREKCSIRQVNMTISLAFLAPELVKAAVDGRLPRGVGIARLRDAPAEWARQHTMLGLARRSITHLCDGGLIGTFIDWRGYPLAHAAAIGHGLVPINLCVWTKTNGGMGSLYRSSQHELFPLYKKGTAAHVNNIELGKNGRWRSNVWCYAGASSISSDSRKGLELHPTVKPAAMLTDAILDLTQRGEIVLDPFLGSGSTLIAAHGIGRRCFGIPHYVDVILQRAQAACGVSAMLESTGETFEVVARRREQEVARA